MGAEVRLSAAGFDIGIRSSREEALASVDCTPPIEITRGRSTAVAAKLGLGCVLVQEHWVEWPDAVYASTPPVTEQRGLETSVSQPRVSASATRYSSFRVLLPPYAWPRVAVLAVRQISTSPPRCSLSRSWRCTGDGRTAAARARRCPRFSRDRAHPIARRACVFLRVKDDHREPVRRRTAGRPRPVARLETGRARDLRHNPAVEQFPSAVSIVDGHAYDERMHLGLLSGRCRSAELNAPPEAPHDRLVL